jgi:integrase
MRFGNSVSSQCALIPTEVAVSVNALAPVQPAHTPAVADRLAEYEQDAAGAYSANTQRAVRADTAVFAEWCSQHGDTSLPAAPETVKTFVQDQGSIKAVATVRRYLASIAHLHRAAGLSDPTKTQKVRLALKALARSRGTRQKQARGLNLGLVDRLLDATPDTLRGKRDAALLAVAYSTLARRSELIALDVDDVEWSDDGSATILIRRSKADPTGEGSVRYLAPKAARALADWLAAAGIEEGAVFRSTPRGREVGKRLYGNAVPMIYKRLAEAAGIKPEQIQDISGHSTRVGAAQDLVAVGTDLAQVMRDGGWRSPQMVARYSERQAVKHGGMAKLAAVKGWD